MIELTKAQVFSIKSHREKKEQDLKEQSFKCYLNSLKQDQLQHEAIYLMNKFQNEHMTNETLRMSAMLMEELAKRVDVISMKESIKNFAFNIRNKIETDELNS